MSGQDVTPPPRKALARLTGAPAMILLAVAATVMIAMGASWLGWVPAVLFALAVFCAGFTLGVGVGRAEQRHQAATSQDADR